MWLIDIAWDLQKLGITLENKVPDELLDILVDEVLDFLSGMASYL